MNEYVILGTSKEGINKIIITIKENEIPLNRVNDIRKLAKEKGFKNLHLLAFHLLTREEDKLESIEKTFNFMKGEI